MQFFEASSVIEASPQTIWSIITDGPNIATWDSGVVRIEGKIAPGETIKLVSSANPGRAFPLKVTEFTPPSNLTLTGGMPLGLFKGVRTYTLTPQGTATKFDMREEYTGLLLPLIWRTIPDLNPSFQQYAVGLKKRAESAS